MKLSLKIGKSCQELEIPPEHPVTVLTPNDIPRKGTEEEEICTALTHPIGSPRLCQLVKPGERIAIVTSDITRPMPTHKVMPYLLDELYLAGVRREDITLVFALGSHRPHTENERKSLAGERAWQEIRCVDSDPSDCICMGRTTQGTPVDITRTVALADRRICLGNIEYHYFAGYSGGAKAIMPGVSTRQAIQANHKQMVHPLSCVGNLETNPVRKDIEEAAGLCGVDFILNVVLDEHKKIIYACAGDVIAAHRKGCTFLDTLYQKKIYQPADIVVVSQGGYPKDLNLYQTQKALDNASHAVKEGGTILLMGSCREGLGEKTFEQWITDANHPQELVDRIQQDFRLGGHKAAAIAMVLARAEICLVSEMEPEFVRSLFLHPCPTIQDAFAYARKKHGPTASVIIMPYGGSTLPRLMV